LFEIHVQRNVDPIRRRGLADQPIPILAYHPNRHFSLVPWTKPVWSWAGSTSKDLASVNTTLPVTPVSLN
jgi:hypothetical protein